jgi:hypothetical protein
MTFLNNIIGSGCEGKGLLYCYETYYDFLCLRIRLPNPLLLFRSRISLWWIGGDEGEWIVDHEQNLAP